MERRFGLDSAIQTVAAVRVGELIDVGRFVGIGQLVATPPLPDAPGPTETAIELPWRLIVSPNDRAAWAHSPAAVVHDGRIELWHTRLGLRATAKDGTPTVDEISTYYRTVRAIWSRDFDEIGPPASTRRPSWPTSPARTRRRTRRSRCGPPSTAATG